MSKGSGDSRERKSMGHAQPKTYCGGYMEVMNHIKTRPCWSPTLTLFLRPILWRRGKGWSWVLNMGRRIFGEFHKLQQLKRRLGMLYLRVFICS